MEREQINPKTFYILENKNIKAIEIRTVGLLDVFGKVEIDITYNNDSKQNLVGISPIDTDEIKRWLEENNLLEKTKLYKF